MKTQSGKIRIISGDNKGRVLQFPAVDGLRPTPERIRETLFNWLTPCIYASVCLDLFAGSGALGFEALSRGAKNITFIESNRNAARAVEKNIRTLNYDNAKLLNQDSMRYLVQCSTRFDVVFLDPPFNSSLLQTSMDMIDKKDLLCETGWVYAEYSAHQQQPNHPARWKLHRRTRAGDVSASLFQYCGDESDR